jgi:photosystem II stability/assembly factor-like uncharacterized protein
LYGATIATAQPSTETWQRIGPGGGGSTFSPTFSYHSPNDFILKCDMTGSYLTNNGGRSYSLINFVGGANCYAYDPNDSNRLYAGGPFLHRSVDGGKTWQPIFPKTADIRQLGYFGDHAEFQLKTNDTALYKKDANEINVIYVDPAWPKTIYFALGHFFVYSVDDGQHWAQQDIHSGIKAIYTNNKTLKNKVYIFTANAIFIFNKSSKTIIKNDLPGNVVPASAFSVGTVKNTNKTIIYALRQGQIFTSSDDGRTWQPATDPVISFTTVVCAAADAAQAYVITDHYVDSTNKVWYGALKTDDQGKSWHWVWKAGGGSGQYRVQDANDAENVKDSWVHTAFGSEFIQLLDAGVSPKDGNIAILTDWYRTMKTTNGGKTWTEIYSQKNPDGTYATRGLDVTTTYGIHFDPFTPNHLAISYTDIGFHHSDDGGKTWRRSVTGVPIDWNNTCYWVVFDPVVKNKLWSVWSGMHDLPRGKMTRDPHWKTSAIAKGGACLSTDGGVTWQPALTGMGDNSPATSIVIDPASPPNHRTLYATVYNKGVFKSVDDGQTWSLKNNGLDSNTCAFKIILAANGDLFLTVSLTPAYNGGKKAMELYSGAVYKSVDGAETWKKLNLTTGLLFPNGIAVDPTNPNKIYVACWASLPFADLPGGIFASDDGGATWLSIFDQRQYVYDVTIDPYHPGRLYCNTFNQAAYRSDDGGKSWKQLKGYDFHWGHRVIIDENDHEKVYITTYGSSVWHGVPSTISHPPPPAHRTY